MTRRELLKSGVRAGLLALMGIGVAGALRQTVTRPAKDGARCGCDEPRACTGCRLAACCPRKRADRRGS